VIAGVPLLSFGLRNAGHVVVVIPAYWVEVGRQWLALVAMTPDVTRPSPLDEPSLALVFRSFRKAMRRLEGALKKSGGIEGGRFSLNYTAERGVAGRFEEPPSFAQLAALLRPFMARTSNIELERIRHTLDQSGLLNGDHAKTLAVEFERAGNLGVSVVLNGRSLTARDICFAYGDGHLFQEDPEAKALLEELSVGPTRDLVPFLFHTACLNYVRLVRVVAEVIGEIERAHPELRSAPVAYGKCIYCLTTEGTFRSEEHVIPEAFGQDELVLIGCVCDTCNNRLSTLDQFLAEFEPLAMLRVPYVPLTKKGRFPRARMRDADLEKTRPRHIRLREKSGRSSITVEELDGERVKFTVEATSRRKFEPVMLGRALFKIGLGLIAAQAGPAVACGPRFDAARDFINGKRQGMPSALWLPSEVAPEPQIRTMWWQPDNEHTIMTINFFGLWLAFDLEGDGVGEDVSSVPGVLAFPLETGSDSSSGSVRRAG
jgi:hypothetical protein